MATSEGGRADREAQLLREVHEALDALEHHLRELGRPRKGEPVGLVELVLGLRREIIEAFQEPPSTK